MPEVLSRAETFDVAQAMLTVIEDNRASEQTYWELKSIADKERDYATSGQLDTLRNQYRGLLDMRWNYALRSLTSRALRESEVVGGVVDLAAENLANGTPVPDRYLGTIHRAITATMLGSKSIYWARQNEQHQIRYGEGDKKSTPSILEDSRPYDVILPSPAAQQAEADFYRSIDGTQQVRIEQGLPDPHRPGKIWISVANPRALSVRNGPPETITQTLAVTDTVGDAAYVTAGPIYDQTFTPKQLDAMRQPDGTINFPEDWYFLSGATESDGSMQCTFAVGPRPHQIDVSEDSDVYRFNNNRSRVEVYIPRDRLSLEAAWELAISGLVQQVRHGSSYSRMAELQLALAAAGGHQGNVIETFRPINEKGGGPHVNPRPVQVGKSN
jgi:hypothetical protein